MAKSSQSASRRMSRTIGGTKRRSGDTLVETLRETYGNNFARGYRADTKLADVLRKEGYESLSEYLKKKHRPAVQTYTAVVHHEEGWFVAECPEVGVVSQGKTFDEAVANLKEATELYLEEFPPPPPQRAVITTFDVSYA